MDIVERLRVQDEHGIFDLPEEHEFVSYGDAADEIEKLRDEIFNLKTEVHFDDQMIKSLQVIKERLQRDVEEANARAYVMAKEVTLWQSRAALKEGE